ncbi:hypothetical protein BT93_D1726 [Corymbia citriodora subsp. variegata]|nr:hypothetical protein BT93_D1726 [Corymbia citriodora subsp. variegata]
MAFLPLLGLVILLSNVSPEVTRADDLQTYIIHVSHPDGQILSEDEDIHSWYRSFLPDSTQTSENQQRMLYAYQYVMTGFAARLTPEEVAAMQKKEGFISAHPEKMYHTQTTHSPKFLGLPQQQGSLAGLNLGKGVIIGVLDTGIFPSHPSFSGAGMKSPPAKWKGRCEFKPFQCNNKLIGARSFDLSANRSGIAPPIDEDGHGTHTVSTAAGAFVSPADALGNARGTAVGMAPDAHLAIYKVCFGKDCPEADILTGLDTAIADGVDVLSMSLGGPSAPFFTDTIAVGAFAAIQKGIFVSCSAGNSGPFPSTLSNDAPWILTVGASTIDRNIRATVKLGNGMEYHGESLFQPHFPSTLLPLVYAGRNGNNQSALCAPGSLQGIDVKGKVVLCERGVVSRIDKGQEVKDAGGIAMILMNQESDAFSTSVDAHVLPASHVSFSAGEKIKSYINSTKYPTATIVFKGTVIGNPTAPAIASLSSRGPSTISPEILKPDIIGPGVSILAAWPFPLNNFTKSKFTFNVVSGTSMSCPHLSGIAALIKSTHPYWSPAAVKSAIMTTADQQNLMKNPILDQTLQPADVFATGAGHVNPLKALEPGLIYDIQPDDYIAYLCGLGYSNKEVGVIAHRSIKCSRMSSIPKGQLNYPSFQVALGPSQTFTRTVTNVGAAYSTYVIKVVPPPSVFVSVKPAKLYFSKVGQKATYSVTFSRTASTYKAGEFTQGHLKWVSGKYSVRSPISVKFE